jgi:hypothetical protein
MGPNQIDPKITRLKVVELITSRQQRLAPRLRPDNYRQIASSTPIQPPAPPVIQDFTTTISEYTGNSEIMTAIYFRYAAALETLFNEQAAAGLPVNELFDDLIKGSTTFSEKHYGDFFHFINLQKLDLNGLRFLSQLGGLYRRPGRIAPPVLEAIERIMVVGLEQPKTFEPLSAGRDLEYFATILTSLKDNSVVIDWLADETKADLVRQLISWGRTLAEAFVAVRDERVVPLSKAVTLAVGAEGLIIEEESQAGLPSWRSTIFRLKDLLRQTLLERAEQPLALLIKTAAEFILDPVVSDQTRRDAGQYLRQVIKDSARASGQDLVDVYLSSYLAGSPRTAAGEVKRTETQVIAEVLLESPSALPSLLRAQGEINAPFRRAGAWLFNLFGVRNRLTAIFSLRPILRQMTRTNQGQAHLLQALVDYFCSETIFSRPFRVQLQTFSLDKQLARQLVNGTSQWTSNRPIALNSLGIETVRDNIARLKDEDNYSDRELIFLGIKLWQLADLLNKDQADSAIVLADDLDEYTGLAAKLLSLYPELKAARGPQLPAGNR